MDPRDDTQLSTLADGPGAGSSGVGLEVSGANRLRYHPALDGLRALSVLAVIAYHFGYRWAQGGFLGVDAFFVLSGFLITTLLVFEFRRIRTIKLGGFWGRRARRLLPALLLVLLFVAWYTHHYVAPWERTSIRNDGIASLFYVANWRFILDQQSYFTLFSAASPLRHMWSLAIEEQFYLVWPLIVLGCLRAARGSTRVLAAVCTVGAIASVIAMAVLYQDGDPSRAYYGTDTHAHTLLIGALLALILAARPIGRRVRQLLMIAGPLALVAVGFAWHSVLDTSSKYYHGGSAIYALVVAVVIAAVMAGGPFGRMLGVGPLAWIGRLSYGLYLWHWPIVVWLIPTRVHVGPNQLNLIRLAVTFAAAITSYYLVERPIREGLATRARPTAILAPVAVGMVSIALVASAAGATPPPSYLWGYGDPLVCGTPRPEETREAKTEVATQRPIRRTGDAKNMRVLIVGDSVACSLWTGMREVGRRNRIPLDQASIFGCGVASGEITTTRGEQITPHSERCPQLVDTALRDGLARARPNVVVWASSWEKSDLVVDGKTLVNGTKAGDRAMLARMDEALKRLTRGGAHVMLVTIAAPAPNDAQGTDNTSNAVDDASYVRLASIERRFAKRHPGQVTLIDLAGQLCPTGAPCPETVNGERIRPDGRHFTPASAARYGRWILAQIAKHEL